MTKRNKHPRSRATRTYLSDGMLTTYFFTYPNGEPKNPLPGLSYSFDDGFVSVASQAEGLRVMIGERKQPR